MPIYIDGQSLSYSWLTKVMDHLSYWLFIVYFSSWQIGWQQDPFQLYIYWCSRPNRVVISLMIPPLISSYWLTHLSCQYLMCYTQQLLHTHCSIGPFKPSKINFAKSNFLVYYYCVVYRESLFHPFVQNPFNGPLPQFKSTVKFLIWQTW